MHPSHSTVAEKKNVYQPLQQSGGGTENVITKVMVPSNKPRMGFTVLKMFGSDSESGIIGDAEDIGHRRNYFGSNTYDIPHRKGKFHLLYEGLKNTTILTLLAYASAIIPIALGTNEDTWKDRCLNGCTLFMAFFLHLLDYVHQTIDKWKKFKKLSCDKNNIQIEVLRNGRQQQVSVSDIVVGDIVCLKTGDQIPADGIFLDGHPLQVDGYARSTGESNLVEVDENKNQVLRSGAIVVDGYARMLVTSVGMNTAWGEMMSLFISPDSSKDQLNNMIFYVGVTHGRLHKFNHFLFLIGEIMFVRLLANKYSCKIETIGRSVYPFVMLAILSRKALENGLSLILLYSKTRIRNYTNMVRELGAYQLMGSTTTICTDKIGTLMLNQMKVTEFCLGQDVIRGCAASRIGPTVLELLHHGAGLNTTGSAHSPSPTSGTVPEFFGNPTEKAILSWAVLELGLKMEELNGNCSILHYEPFNSEKKRCGALIRKKSETTIHVHCKGVAEMILPSCSNYYDRDGIMKAMNKDEREKFERTIQGMVANNLQCIAFAHKEIREDELEYNEQGKTHQLLNGERLTLLGIVAMKEPYRPGVKEAVKACKDAGVGVKMITEDNVFNARAIATECGILEDNHELHTGKVVEGIEFRNYTEVERMQKVESICVMARSSPNDKLLMVQCLKQKGHVVAVTGDGINDALALKEADIGLSTGIYGAEMAKQFSDIVILDDNFAFVLTNLRWGRCVYNNIQKFIQFQLTVNVVALVVNLVTATSTGEVPLKPPHLYFVYGIVHLNGAISLASMRPTKNLMEKRPIGRRAPLITNIKWRNFIAQALYQIVVLLTLQFKGESVFHVNAEVKDSLIFNTFLLCQMLNIFNAWKTDKRNVFKGIHKDWSFLMIMALNVVFQVVIAELPEISEDMDIVRLSRLQWIACIGVAAVSWPIGWIVKYIPVPDKPILCLLKEKASQVLI